MERKEIKINLATFICLIIIAILLVVVVGMYMVNKEEKVNGDNSNVSPNVQLLDNNSDKGISFEKLMDTLYLPTEFKIKSNVYYNDIIVEENFEGEFSAVQYLHNKVTLSYNEIPSSDDEPEIIRSCDITGINEEIVDIKMNTDEVSPKPMVIYFLTRSGNVYICLDPLQTQNPVAQKVPNLSKVIAIKGYGAEHEGSMEVSYAVLALKYDGTYEDIDYWFE